VELDLEIGNQIFNILIVRLLTINQQLFATRIISQ